MGSKVIVIKKVEDIPEKTLQRRIEYYKMIHNTDEVDVRQIQQSFIGKYIRVDT